MGDKDTSTQDGNNGAATSGASDGFKPITSQEDLDRIIGDRISRERAKYSDYADLKAKADKFDELEAANKSEVEKAAEKAAAAERERDAARAEALRLRVATKHGVTDPDDIDLFLTGTDEETLTKQAERLTQRASDRKRNGNVAPKEGSTSQPGDDPMRTWVRGLFDKAE